MTTCRLFLAVVLCFHVCAGKPTPPMPTKSEAEISNTLPGVETEAVRTKALDDLRNVFGFTNRSHFSPAKDQSPPQYMVDLYNTITHAGGITDLPNPYNANTVRSFLDKSHKQRMYYTFNLTKIPSSDRILRAELHLFKMKPKIKIDARRQHYFQVHLFKLTTDDPKSTEGAELIGMRLISTQRTGWEVFTITKVVESWIANSTMNLGLLLTVTNLNGEIMEESGIRFAQRGKHHDSKQPNLVIFSDDGRPKPAGLPLPKEAGVDSGYDYIIETYDNTNIGEHVADSSETRNTDTTEEFKHVMKRHAMMDSNSTTKSNDVSESGKPGRENHKGKTRRSERSGPCSLQPMYVDFDVIGWSDWIISPQGYNANKCDGKCAFPLTSLVNPSNHASVQSLINTLNLGSNVGEPCCVPNETEHITLLYYTDDDNVVLKHFDGMIATSCGCQ